MDLPKDIRPRLKRATERCNEQIAWYERYAARAKVLFRGFQSAAVVLAGLTPIVTILTDLKPYQALPAALASIAVATSALWGWQENWVRFAATAEALKSELLRFETRTGEAYRTGLDDETVLGNFVARTEAWSRGRSLPGVRNSLMAKLSPTGHGNRHVPCA